MFRAPLRRLRPASLPATRVHVLTARRATSTSTSTNTTTAGGKRKGTWKAGAARWGVAAGALYWYWTSPLFADDPAPVTKAAPVEDEDVTVDRIVEEKRREMEARARARQAKEAEEAAALQAKETEEAAALQAEAEQKLQEDDAPGAATATEPTNPEDAEAVAAAAAVAEGGSDAAAPAAASSPAGDDDGESPDMSQEAAYNPETGEINWDCPCLGGMAHGPCGEQFREAFSCFVHSTEEPKGMDCIDKFQGMQDCFRLHPDVYGAELAEEAEAEAEAEAAAAVEGDARTEAPRGEDAEAAPPQDDGPAATPEDDGSAAAAPEAVSEEAASDAIKAEAKPDAKTES